MSIRTWRWIGATMMLFALSGHAAHVSAQDCPNCPMSSDDVVYADDMAAPVVSGHAARKAARRAMYGCPGSRCNWYRPFSEESQPDVFYNLYQPNNFGAAAAAYPAPYPTPNLIGHTYYTYQPLMPHEFLYHHSRTYHQYYNRGMGLNRTKVRWYGTPVRTTLKGIYDTLSLPR